MMKKRSIYEIEEPVQLSIAAGYLRVPVGWLREEIDAGRIPALKAGRVYIVHVPTAARIIAERAKIAKGGGS